MFVLQSPDARVGRRANTRLIRLPRKHQTIRILREFLFGDHNFLFYLKASPASRYYMGLRKRSDGCTIVGTMESQANFKQEPSIPPKAVRLWEQTVLRCDHLFSNSESVRRSLMLEYGRDSQIIPTGVDSSFFTPDWGGTSNARLRVLFVGSLRSFKQPQFLLAAAARFPSADFRIAGDGPLALALKESIGRENLCNVTLMGVLGPAELRDEYRRADIFLFPSAWEGSPKVILEAAACGLPAIIRNDYSAETVTHGGTGFQCASDDELFSYLEVLLLNADLRREFGHNARKLSERYDWNLITESWEETFLRLSERRALRTAS